MLGSLVVVGTLVIILVVHARARATRTEALSIAAAILGGEYSVPDGAAWGTKLGPRVELKYTTRGSGSSSESWTEIAVDLPPGYPLAVFVRRHGLGDRSQVARGEMVDVEVGDPTFDAEFLIEAAPAAIAIRLLDAPARAFLAGYVDVELIDRGSGDSHVLVFATKGWLQAREQLLPALEATAAIGRGVRDAFAAADAAIEPVDTGSPYRPQLDDQPARDEQARRANEVRAIGALRVQREARRQRDVVLAAVIVGIVFVISIALMLSAATAR